MENNEFLDLLKKALKNELVKKEIIKIVNENSDKTYFENNKIEINSNDEFSRIISFIQNIQKEHEKIKSENLTKETKINSLTSENKELKTDLEKQLDSKESDMKKLNNEIEILNNKISNLENNNKRLSDENIKLESSLIEKENEIKELKTDKDTEINTLNEKISNLNINVKSLKTEKDNLNSKLLEYENNCKREMEIYQKFLSLSDEIKTSLKRTFKGNGLSDFISCGVQNIDNFWEYVKSETIKHEIENDDTKKLVEIFYFLFEKYRVSQNNYEIIDTNEGDIFDTKLHIKHNSSPENSGEITKVYLKGYKNIRKDKIEKQSIVKVG
jgi:predicted  nucleic acid-binding Zn-ribbon protein